MKRCYDNEEFDADRFKGFSKRLNRIFYAVSYFKNVLKHKVFAFVHNALLNIILQETRSLVLSEDYF